VSLYVDYPFPRSDASLLTARHTIVELRRDLVRLLELDEVTCEAAATVAEVTGGADPGRPPQAQAARAMGLTVVGT
jgi:hypothetical protein